MPHPRLQPASCVILLVTLAIAGCEARSHDEAAERQKAATREHDSTAAAGETASAGKVGPAPADTSAREPVAGSASSVVRVVLTEWQVKLSPDTVPSGHVSFRIVNRGKEDHAIELEPLVGGDDLNREGSEIAPGKKQTLTYDLPPGTWSVDCPLASPSANGGHALRGMRSTLVVR
jgi:uncharacterized cupredoxin-like copper-binding protein